MVVIIKFIHVIKSHKIIHKYETQKKNECKTW